MPYYPDEVTEIRLPAGVRANRAKRRSRQRVRRIATVAVLAFALVALGSQARSWAWTAAISGKGVCNTQTGQYDLAWTLDNTSEPEPASVTGDLSATVPAHGTKTVTESVPGSTSGSVSRTVRINWPSDQANLERTATVELTGDCKKPVTTTTTTPDTTTPDDDKDEFAGTATDQSRTPPDQHGTPTEKKAPPVTRPPLNQLPFTGPEHPFGMNDLQWAAFLIALGMVTVGGLMVVAGRRRYQRMLRSVEPPQWGEARVRPDRDSADTNLLTTCFHRFNR